MLINLLVLAAVAYYGYWRMLHLLRFLQQDTYYPGRFLRWCSRHAFDLSSAVICVTIAALSLTTPTVQLLAILILPLCAILHGDPRRRGKVLLTMTERAKRILAVALFLAGAALLATLRIEFLWLRWLTVATVLQLLPLTLAGAVLLLAPGERRRQRRLQEEAERILAQVNPYIVGITGSYGKTSTKHLLGHLLQAAVGTTFWPPKGVNTVMGITRSIRERLCPGMQYAVIEMAAYGRGSIAKLCQFTPPQAAIITCIGKAHLERFGAAENILSAKRELAEALPADGILVVNADNTGCRTIAEQMQLPQTYTYSLHRRDADCYVDGIQMNLSGTRCAIHWKGKQYPIRFPQLGETALSNLLAAFTMACALGGDPEYIAAAAGTVEPVDNRLQLARDGEVHYLRDAYNSNPDGFSAALDVLNKLPAKRKILMTPGMIELGEEQYAENVRIGELAAQKCDLAVIVGETNRLSLKEGLLQGGMSRDEMMVCATRSEAFERLAAIRQSGDLILIENDLPDLYESVR